MVAKPQPSPVVSGGGAFEGEDPLLRFLSEMVMEVIFMLYSIWMMELSCLGQISGKVADPGHLRQTAIFPDVIPKAENHVDHAWILHSSADSRPIY
jgi:hypothetical protein